MGSNIVEIIIKGVDKASAAFKSAAGGSEKLEDSVGSLVKTLGLAAIAGTALKKGLDFVAESTVLAARVETLGAVTEVMGRNAGISAQEVDKLEKSIQAQGITTQASRQALAQMMRAEIDLARATDLARLAQDAAVISGENSSQSFEKLTQIIGTGNTFMARRMGLLVDFEGAYKSLADQLGKSVDDLTQLERVQARTNEVMAQGRTIAGAYEAAMETGGKKAQSYARHLEELKLSLGESFVSSFSTAIDIATDLTDALADMFKADNILNAEVKRGNLTWEERGRIRREVLLTDKTYADVIDDMTLAEKKRNDVLAEGQKIYGQAQTYEAYKDRILDLAFATQGFNSELDMLTETEWTVQHVTEDADAAMLGLSETMDLLGDGVFRGEEALSRYGEAQQIATNKIDGGINALNQSKNAIEAAKQAAQEAAGAMTEYFGLFDNTDNVDVAANLTDQLSDHLVAAATSATAAQEDTQPWLDALALLDPTAAAAAESSTVLAGTLDALDSALASKGITPQEYAAAMEAIALGIGAGVEPSAAMITQLDKLGLAIGEDTEESDLFQTSLDKLVAGSPYKIEVQTTYTQSGQLPSGISMPTVKTGGGRGPDKGIGGASGLDFTVPSGYPNDSFGPIWAQSGERVQVTPRGETKSGTTFIYNYNIVNQNAEAAAISAAIIQSREMEQLRNH